MKAIGIAGSSATISATLAQCDAYRKGSRGSVINGHYSGQGSEQGFYNGTGRSKMYLRLAFAAAATCAACITLGSTPYGVAFAKLYDFGNKSNDIGGGTVIDAAGNIYERVNDQVSGQSLSYLCKFDSFGNLVWKQPTYFPFGGGSSGISVDANGNMAYTTFAQKSTYGADAVFYQLDAKGALQYTQRFPGTDTTFQYGMMNSYDSAGFLHGLIFKGYPADLGTVQISGDGQATTYISAGSFRPDVSSAYNGTFLCAGPSDKGQSWALIGGNGTVLNHGEYTDTLDNNGNGDQLAIHTEFDPSGNAAVAIVTDTYRSSTLTAGSYSLQSYSATGTLAWQLNGLTGNNAFPTPISQDEILVQTYNADGTVSLHDFTKNGEQWAFPIDSGSYPVLDDTGGFFVLTNLYTAPRLPYITKYNSSGVKQWTYTYRPPASQTASLSGGVVKNGALYVTGYADNGPTGYDFLLLKLVQGTALEHMGLTTNQTTGPSKITGTVQLNNPAPAGGYLAYVTSSNPPACGVPPQIIVSAGQTQATFTCTTTAVDAPQWVTITASAHGAVSSTAILINPAKLGGISFNPTSVKVGTSVTGALSLMGPTGTSGRLIRLTSSNPSAVQVLPTAYFPAGATLTSFNAKAVGGAGTTVTITASLDGVSKSATLTVTQ